MAAAAVDVTADVTSGGRRRRATASDLGVSGARGSGDAPSRGETGYEQLPSGVGRQRGSGAQIRSRSVRVQVRVQVWVRVWVQGSRSDEAHVHT